MTAGSSVDRVKAAPDPKPGDFLLTHADAWTSKLIRFGEGLRYRGPNRTPIMPADLARFFDVRGCVSARHDGHRGNR